MSTLSLIASTTTHFLFDYTSEVYEYVKRGSIENLSVWHRSLYTDTNQEDSNGVFLFRKDGFYPFERKMYFLESSLVTTSPAVIARGEYLKGARVEVFNKSSLDSNLVMGGCPEKIYVLYQGRYQLLQELAAAPTIEDDWI